MQEGVRHNKQGVVRAETGATNDKGDEISLRRMRGCEADNDDGQTLRKPSGEPRVIVEICPVLPWGE